MCAFARRTLRPRFLAADLGITGVNLGVAETGTLLTVTNEGNGRLTAGAPPVHVAVMGMERVVAELGRSRPPARPARARRRRRGRSRPTSTASPARAARTSSTARTSCTW